MVELLEIVEALFHEIIIGGGNYFITGGAGSGKSFFINMFTCMCNDMGIKVKVTASTWKAALLVSGMTIHSFLSLGKEVIYYKNLDELKGLSFLIIDEVSMLGSKQFGEVYKIIKANNPKLQLIVVGDFCQLPPVNDKYAFLSTEWQKYNFTNIELTKNTRQNDDEFIESLNQIRLGKKDGLDFINKHKSKEFFEDGPIICSRHTIIDRINDFYYKQLDGEEKVYSAIVPNPFIEQDKSEKSFEMKLKLKIGCKVIITANNYWQDYYNGMTGTVVDLNEDEITVKTEQGKIIRVVRHIFKDKLKKHEIKQFPILLAYAITIHKAQGQTVDKLNIIYDTLWEPGHLYTALSRCKDCNNIFVGQLDKETNFKKINEAVKEKRIMPEDLFTDPMVLDFYNKIHNVQ